MMYPYFVQRKGKVGFGDFIFKRWFRTTPTMLGVMWLSFAWAGWGRGPIFRESMNMTVETCKNHWWANVLYINNWFPYERIVREGKKQRHLSILLDNLLIWHPFVHN